MDYWFFRLTPANKKILLELAEQAKRTCLRRKKAKPKEAMETDYCYGVVGTGIWTRFSGFNPVC